MIHIYVPNIILCVYFLQAMTLGCALNWYPTWAPSSYDTYTVSYKRHRVKSKGFLMSYRYMHFSFPNFIIQLLLIAFIKLKIKVSVTALI